MVAGADGAADGFRESEQVEAHGTDRCFAAGRHAVEGEEVVERHALPLESRVGFGQHRSPRDDRWAVRHGRLGSGAAREFDAAEPRLTARSFQQHDCLGSPGHVRRDRPRDPADRLWEGNSFRNGSVCGLGTRPPREVREFRDERFQFAGAHPPPSGILVNGRGSGAKHRDNFVPLTQ
jgi:hypothetical protein